SLADAFIFPLVFAHIIDVVSKRGITNETFTELLFSAVSLVFLRSGMFWAIHGPARVLEQENAFLSRLNYRKYLLKGVFTLPFEWHMEHHSGDTIDKIEKGTSGLYAFSEDSFRMIYAIAKFIIGYAMLIYLNSYAGI